MTTAETRRISDDLRYELSDAARAAEAANKPRSLLVLATVLFLVAGVALIWTLRGYESARTQHGRQVERLATVENLAVQYERVRVLAEQSGGDPGVGPIRDLRSRVEAAASTAGLVSTPSIPRGTELVVGGLIKKTFSYQMQDPSLENLLRWAEESRRRVPGLEVQSLEIRPAARHWNFDITFVRWERPS